MHARIPLVDQRLSKEEFGSLKLTGKIAFDQLPCLVVEESEGGQREYLSQSASIMRYIGKIAGGEVGLYPQENLLQCALIDSIIDQEADMFQGLGCSRYKERFGFGSLSDEQVILLFFINLTNQKTPYLLF